MQRRALLGLALFACLMASGWAWQRFSAPAPEGQGDFVRITVAEAERQNVCSDASDNVPPGILRVGARTVSLSSGSCDIVEIHRHSEETSEGILVTEELGLDCGAGGAGPNALDATLWIAARAQVTTYIATDDGDYVEAHADYLRCAPADPR